MHKPAQVTVEDRLANGSTLLRKVDVVTAELEAAGFITMARCDRWEKLIAPERLRVGQAMKSLGVPPLSKLPSLARAKAVPGAQQ
jgi:hypothetical protein